MKKLFLLAFVALAALAPLLCGRFMLDNLQERLDHACLALGLNPREWQVEKGYKVSSLSLSEPLAGTWSSGGLDPESVKFLKNYGLSVNATVEGGPYNGLLGRQELEAQLSGPDWRLEFQERLERSLGGRISRRLEIRDVTFADGEVAVSTSNCWLESHEPGFFGEGSEGGARGGASFLALLPLGGAKDLSCEYKDGLFSARIGRLVLGREHSFSNVTLECGNDFNCRLEFSSASSPLLESGAGRLQLSLSFPGGEGTPGGFFSLLSGEGTFDWDSVIKAGRAELKND